MSYLSLTITVGKSVLIGEDIKITFLGKDDKGAVLSVETVSGEIVCPGELEAWVFEYIDADSDSSYV